MKFKQRTAHLYRMVTWYSTRFSVNLNNLSNNNKNIHLTTLSKVTFFKY